MSPSSLAIDLKARVPLFHDVPEEDLAQLLATGRVAAFEAREAIVECGEEGTFLGILIEGEAEVSYADDSGMRHQLAVLRPGEVFGEMALMTGDKTTADVIGKTPCRAVLIPQARFSTFLASHPRVIQRVSRLISERAKERGSRETDRALASAAWRKSEDPYGLTLRTPEPMKLLVLDSAASSLAFRLYETAEGAVLAQGRVEGIGTAAATLAVQAGAADRQRPVPGDGHRTALAAILDALASPEGGVIRDRREIGAVGHRVAHGGARFSGPALATDDVIREIESLADLAPASARPNAAGIRAAQDLLPQAHQVAVFDTAFHHTLPPYAAAYGLPFEHFESGGIRRCGFHGLSHLYVSLRAAQFLKRPFNELEIVSCHLGHDTSLCAIDHGRSVDTSMGLTHAEGLIMGTRSGDLDPGVIPYLMRTRGLSVEDIERLIHRESGLLGLSGLSGGMREIEQAAQQGHARALLAFKSYCYRVRKYIGAYCAAMNGVDAVVFTGGIGQGSPGVRSLATQGLGALGIQLDEEKNRRADGLQGVSDIAAADARVRILVIPDDEERMIARETIRAVSLSHVGRILRGQKPFPIPIEISAHHVHLSQQHVEALFGPGHQLTRHSDLSQPGQFACKEQVTLVGPKGRVDRVRVLGPARQATQVEIAMTEQFKLGIHPPIRESGDLSGTPGVTLEGPAGSVTLTEGVICALRHIHMTPEDAMRFGLRDKNNVQVRVRSGQREIVFGDVLVRVSPSYRLALHLDTDEGNAANIATGATGTLDAIQATE